MFKRTLVAALTALPFVAAPVIVSAQAPQQMEAETMVRKTARGEITKIDMENAEVTVKTPDGRELKIPVQQQTAQRLKKGDIIELEVGLKVSRPAQQE